MHDFREPQTTKRKEKKKEKKKKNGEKVIDRTRQRKEGLARVAFDRFRRSEDSIVFAIPQISEVCRIVRDTLEKGMLPVPRYCSGRFMHASGITAGFWRDHIMRS